MGYLYLFLRTNKQTALVAISKGMRAVKLCTNKILLLLTGGAS